VPHPFPRLLRKRVGPHEPQPATPRSDANLRRRRCAGRTR
jgi:hypothetical protein